jgi:hypothetical protein
MNTQTQEVPLIELLKAVPKTARLIVESEDGISSRAHPVGDLCHKAAEALETKQVCENAAPAQEPVAIVMEDSYGYGASLYKRLPLGTKLYTHPAQPLTRDWIGTVLERADKDEAFRKGLIGELAQPLSDDEIYKMADDSYILVELIQGKGMVFDRLKFARAIEQASRSKNDKSG